MNIAELISQFYNFTMVVPLHSNMKRKYKKYFCQLLDIKHGFFKQGIHHTSIDHLTSLMFAYNRNIQHMKLYGYEYGYRASITQNILEIEKCIRKAIGHCNTILDKYEETNIRRHSF